MKQGEIKFKTFLNMLLSCHEKKEPEEAKKEIKQESWGIVDCQSQFSC